MKLLFNPFEKYNEAQLFIFGLAGVLLCSFLAYFFNLRFPTVFNIAPLSDVEIWQPLTDNFIIIACLTVFLFIASLVINRKTRIIDILNTTLVARSLYCVQPLIMLGFSAAGFDKFMRQAKPQIHDLDFTPGQLVLILLLSLLIIAVIVWYVALLYNGFKTATNLKAAWHKVLFGITLLIAEIITPLLILTIN